MALLHLRAYDNISASPYAPSGRLDDQTPLVESARPKLTKEGAGIEMALNVEVAVDCRTGGQEAFDVAQTQAIQNAEPDGVLDDGRRELMAGV